MKDEKITIHFGGLYELNNGDIVKTDDRMRHVASAYLLITIRDNDRGGRNSGFSAWYTRYGKYIGAESVVSHGGHVKREIFE